jgi:predicted NUDIX family phosphoesterase
MKRENILCIQTSLLESLTMRTGFVGSEEIDLERLAAEAWYAPRHLVEDDPGFRQLIPYLVLRHEGRVGIYRRGQAGDEGRLHDLFSIGFGGHVGLRDAVVADDGTVAVWPTVMAAAERELTEEVEIPDGRIGERVLGLINDPSNPVGAVHLGVLVEVLLRTNRVFSREEDQIELVEFVPVNALQTYRLESWSQVAAQALATEQAA